MLLRCTAEKIMSCQSPNECTNTMTDYLIKEHQNTPLPEVDTLHSEICLSPDNSESRGKLLSERRLRDLDNEVILPADKGMRM